MKNYILLLLVIGHCLWGHAHDADSIVIYHFSVEKDNAHASREFFIKINHTTDEVYIFFFYWAMHEISPGVWKRTKKLMQKGPMLGHINKAGEICLDLLDDRWYYKILWSEGELLIYDSIRKGTWVFYRIK